MIVKALAPSAKTTLCTWIGFVMAIAVVVETARFAMSFWPFGTTAGVQLAGLFQLLSIGLRFQVALPA